MKSFLSWLAAYVRAHKFVAAIVVIILLVVGYVGYKKAFASGAQTRYVLAAVERGTLIVSVSGTGQVSATNEVEVKPKVSGDVTSVKVKAGDEVKAGQALVTIESTDAARAVRNARTAVLSAQAALEKAKLQSGQSSVKVATDLDSAREDGYSALADASVELPAIMTDIDNILYGTYHSPYFTDLAIRTATGSQGMEYKDKAGHGFDAARTEFQSYMQAYRSMSKSSSIHEVAKMLDNVIGATKDLALSAKDLYNAIDFVKSNLSTVPTQLTTDQTTLSGHISKLNARISSLQNAKQAIVDAKNSSSTSSISVGGESDSIDVWNAKVTLQDKQNALQDALETLADYTVRAPFAGVVAKVDLKVGDAAGTGSAAATVLTKQKIATISLNEVDAAKVKVGQRATLAFDALPDLTITGQVSEIDGAGTVSQGVVSYAATIAFDTQDDRVKSGMSVTATVIIGSKSDVLLVPSSAVKTANGSSYVQTLPNVTAADMTQTVSGVASKVAPTQIPVTTGASNDEETEVAYGLEEGDIIITRTITASTNSAQRSTGGIFGGQTGGARATGGNAVRITR